MTGALPRAERARSSWTGQKAAEVGAEARSRFTGRIPKVTIEVRDTDAKADAAGGAAQKEVARRTE